MQSDLSARSTPWVRICNHLRWCGCCSCGTVLPGCVRVNIALHISLIAALLHSTVQFGPEWKIPRRHWTIKTSRPTYKPVGNLLFTWEFIGFVMFSSVVLLCCCLSSHTPHTQHIATSLCVFHAVCSLCFTLCSGRSSDFGKLSDVFFLLLFFAFLTLLVVLLQTMLSVSLKKKK